MQIQLEAQKNAVGSGSHFAKIQEIIADALYVEKSQVTRDANLMKDLGAESIDFLDIIFRLEKAFNIKIPKGEIERRARGTLADEDFAINGMIQPAGISNLQKTMPELDFSSMGPRLFIRDIPSLFTVATFERLVSERLESTSVASHLSVAPVAVNASL